MTSTGDRVVAIVPAKDRADSIAATVEALTSLSTIDRVVVVDDGSNDDTGALAVAAGATVIRLATNRGKGGAVAVARDATPDADIYLLIDADLGATAVRASALVEPVLRDEADMTIAVLPPAGTRGGFGAVKRFARWGIRRAVAYDARSPLSGQRAIRAELFRTIDAADRFGLETGLTIDAVGRGARIVEVEIEMDHRHTGRRVVGFLHRARQGADIARALWPRLTSRRSRIVLMAVAFLAASLGALWLGGRAEPRSVPLGAGQAVDRVVVFGFPRLAWDDLEDPNLPTVRSLTSEGAVAAMSVRTRSGRPSAPEAYASLGAGTRVRADYLAGYAFGANDPLEHGTAGAALARRTGVEPDGDVVVVGAPGTVALNEGEHLTSAPGALGDALATAGMKTGVVGNSDTDSRSRGRAGLLRPAAAAVMDSNGVVDVGSVGPELLVADPTAPFGQRADTEQMIAATMRALGAADVVVVDSGDIERSAEFADVAAPDIATSARLDALVATDVLLGRLIEKLPPRTLLLVVSPVPPEGEWHLAPVIAYGPGVENGQLHSPSTRRAGIVTLTDIAPTILDALDVAVPEGMIGHPLRARPGATDIDRLEEADRDAAFREGIYLPLTLTYIVIQAGVYLVAIIMFSRLGGAGRAGRVLRFVVLAISAYPVATFAFRAIPDVAALGSAAVVVLAGLNLVIAAVALRARRHPLAPLSTILGATVALLAIDVATGAHLQTSSLLGYSLHTAARFTGFGNTAFATLASTSLILGAIHVHYAPRKREALVAVALLFGFVVVIDGSPALGSDVGGILTLVPVFGLTLLVLSGRRVSWRAVAVAGVVTMAALVLATGVDLLRPVDTRTHLGRLVTDVRADGVEVFTTTVQRKLSVNFRTYRSPWSWTVVIITAYMLFVLGWTRGWRDLLPPGSALRAGVVGVLAAGLLGYAVNDSGVVVTALVFVYLGPFLTMLALVRERGAPVIIEPEVAGAAIMPIGRAGAGPGQ